MRPENERMKAFLMSHGITATPKYVPDGSLKGSWRVWERKSWTAALAEKLASLGFTDLWGKPLTPHTGTAGSYCVFLRGHDEMLAEPEVKEPVRARAGMRVRLILGDLEFAGGGTRLNVVNWCAGQVKVGSCGMLYQPEPAHNGAINYLAIRFDGRKEKGTFRFGTCQLEGDPLPDYLEEIA